MKTIVEYMVAPVLVLILLMVITPAYAQDLSGCYWSANLNKQVCPDRGGKGLNHNDDTPLFGGCNKKGNLCWGININPPKRHLPIEVYGGEARHLISQGEITYANMDRYGVFHLNVWSRYYDSSFDCDVNVSRRRYHCVENW